MTELEAGKVLEIEWAIALGALPALSEFTREEIEGMPWSHVLPPIDWKLEKTTRHGLAMPASPLADEFYDLMWHFAVQWPSSVLCQNRMSL